MRVGEGVLSGGVEAGVFEGAAVLLDGPRVRADREIQLRAYVTVTVTTRVIGSLSIGEDAEAVVVVLLLLRLIGAPRAEIEDKKRQTRSVSFILMLMELRQDS